jgi:hypothetical protein
MMDQTKINVRKQTTVTARNGSSTLIVTEQPSTSNVTLRITYEDGYRGETGGAEITLSIDELDEVLRLLRRSTE